jgi:putative chitinase
MIKLTTESLRAIFPRAPQAVIDAFVAKQDLLTKAGINATRARLAYFFANIEHECGGFTIPNLTENINYTAARMAAVWPNRFSNAAAVQAKYGTGAGWQKKAFDDIYGNRMGNRRGTSDGSTYIGRGGPQWTGRDGYAALERLTGLPAVANPAVAGQLDKQPEVCTAFWTWKNLNRYADAGDFIGCVKAWNGGTNGLADRQHLMAGNDPIIKRMETVTAIAPSIPAPTVPTLAKPTDRPAEKPAVSTGAKAAGYGGGAVVVVAGAAAQQAGLSAPEILGIITGVSLAFGGAILIGYRLIKGTWPWNSTGKASPELSHLSLQSLAPSSEQLSEALSAVSSAGSPATRSPRRSARKQPRKRSAKPSRKTPMPRQKSNSSKRTGAKKSAPRRKSKSRS